MKIGLDIHGVIDTDPEFFSILTRTLKKQRCEIHILTGEEITEKLLYELKNQDITYDHLFSITTYHKTKGVLVKYKDGNPSWPLINPELWEPTKAQYCKRNNIDLHIDDSVNYGAYFEESTTYILYSKEIKKLLELIVYIDLWRS